MARAKPIRTPIRIAAALALLFAASPALAEDWKEMQVERLTLAIEVPGDMISSGGSAATQHYTDPHGNRATLSHVAVPGGDFQGFVQQMVETGTRNGHWSIGGQTLTPTWATWWAADGDRQMRVRYVPVCGGREAIGVQYDYWLPDDTDADHLLQSLIALGNGCL